jgi:hypothetical protein
MPNKAEVFVHIEKSGIAQIALSLFLVQASLGFEGQTWTSNNAPTLSWGYVASSADGGKLAAAPLSGQLYVSPNGGATWNATTSPSAGWTSLASSADGTVLVAASGFLDVSTDSGATWRQAFAGNRAACSADGERLFSLLNSGDVYTSADKGVTWVPATALPTPGAGIACSADASRIVAISINGALYASTNLGKTWSSNSVPGARWSSIACSADGTKWVVAAGMANGQPGPIYFSMDSATNWNPAEAPITNWVGLSSSADGRNMFASTASDGPLNGANAIYRSTNFGANWTRLAAPTPWWRGMATSADGGRLVVAAIGSIYTAQFIQPPTLNILSTNASVRLSWIIPSTNFVLQETADLISTNWTEVADTSSFDPTTYQESVTRPATGSNSFYRMTLAP